MITISQSAMDTLIAAGFRRCDPFDDCETRRCDHRTYRAIDRPWSELAREMATTALPAPQPLPGHSCHGRCGRRLPPHLEICLSCWWRLPYELRQPIASSYQRDAAAHSAAMATARAWFEAHLGVRT